MRKEYEWFIHLSVCHKVYVVYWLVSFLLLMGLSDYTPLCTCFVIVANFYNSVRLLKHVPIDNLEE